MPLPLTVSCFSKIQIGFTFLVPAHLGSPRKRAVKRVCVCVLLTRLTASAAVGGFAAERWRLQQISVDSCGSAANARNSLYF